MRWSTENVHLQLHDCMWKMYYWNVLVISKFICEFCELESEAKMERRNEPMCNANLLLNVWPDQTIVLSLFDVDPMSQVPLNLWNGMRQNIVRNKKKGKPYPSIIIFNPHAQVYSGIVRIDVLAICSLHTSLSHRAFICAFQFFFRFVWLNDKMRRKNTHTQQQLQTNQPAKYMHAWERQTAHFDRLNGI